MVRRRIAGLVLHLLQRTRGDLPGCAPPAHPSHRQMVYLESLCEQSNGTLDEVIASRWPNRNPDIELSQIEASELIDLLK